MVNQHTMKKALYITVVLFELLTISWSYGVGQSRLSFDDAEQFCQDNYGTHLASIHSSYQFIHAQAQCATLGRVDCWVGIETNPDDNTKYINTDGTDTDYGFEIDGTPIPGEPWATGYPSGSGDRCVIISIQSNRLYRDVTCTRNKFPICSIIKQGTINMTLTTNWRQNDPERAPRFIYNGFATALEGTVEYTGSGVFGSAEQGKIGTIDTDEAKPGFKQIFPITNNAGMNLNVEIDANGVVYLQSWSVPWGYYSTADTIFHYIKTPDIPSYWENIINKTNQATPFDPDQLRLVTFDGIVFISQAALTLIDGNPPRIDQPTDGISISESKTNDEKAIFESKPNAGNETIIDYIQNNLFSFMVFIFICCIGIGIGCGFGGCIGLKLMAYWCQKRSCNKYSKVHHDDVEKPNAEIPNDKTTK